MLGFRFYRSSAWPLRFARADERHMLRIERTQTSDGRPALRLTGELVGPWVEELRNVAEPVQTMDLSEVSFVDLHGAALLRSLLDRHVTLDKCSPFVAELLRVRA